MSNRGTKYVLDANVFLEAQLRYYAFDICQGFWDALVRHELGTIDKIKEKEFVNEELKDWVDKELPDDCIVSTDDEDVIERYGEMMAWVQAQDRYRDTAKAEFASVADGWLVAYAKAHGCIVVTHETPELEGKKRVKIPDVCKAFDVDYTNTFKMLRDVDATFSLDDDEE